MIHLDRRPTLAPIAPSYAEPYLPALRELLNSQAVQQSPTAVATHDGAHAPSSQQDQHIDPAIAGAGYPVSLNHDSGLEDQSSDIRKGRRELSTSKRAAQNRAAQRAFRQRKEAYIGSLQEKVKEYEGLISNYKAVQQENFGLREYIIQLQSRLLEVQGELPPAPAHIDLSRQPPPPPVTSNQPSAPSSSGLSKASMVSNDPAEELRLAAAAAQHAAESSHSSPQDGGSIRDGSTPIDSTQASS